MKSNCLIIAGEKSGEEHCLTFFKELKEKVPEVHFWGVGGDELESEGMELLYHLKDFNAWGISEVITKIPYYYKALKRFEDEVVERGCKTAILIDFQDFNLRLARRLHARGVNVLYYIAPTAWIWKEWRADVLSEVAHTLFTIIPFEKEWYSNKGVKNVQGITHPLWLRHGDLIESLDCGLASHPFEKLKTSGEVVLLPGSRKFEVKGLLPLFAEAAKRIKEKYSIKLSIVKSGSVPEELYAPYMDMFDSVYMDNEITDALQKADLAMAASGTVTLTTALFELPTVVAYKLSKFNAFIYKLIVKYYGPVSLGNIVLGKRVFPELLQAEATVDNVVARVTEWIEDKDLYLQTKNELSKTADLLKGDSISVPDYMAKVISESNN